MRRLIKRVSMFIMMTLALVAPAACGPAPLSGVTAIGAGASHTCAARLDGSVWCWGSNALGQLGVAGIAGSAHPVVVPGVADAVAIAAGQMHTCALRRAGSVACWGANIFGQLGAGDADERGPIEVTGLRDATVVAAGWSHTCALRKDGKVACWGFNGSGQTGTGTLTGPQACAAAAGPLPCARTPVEAKDVRGAKAISAGGDHACVILADGTVGCWGANAHAQLGLGSSVGPETCTLNGWEHSCAGSIRTTKNIANAVAVTAGGYHTCALGADAAVSCWGPNLMGQLATGRQKPSGKPVLSRDLDGATAIAAGLMHTCAILKDGEVRCWGSNNRGQLGALTGREADAGQHSDAIRSTLPMRAGDLTGVTAVACGGEHSCALFGNGTVRCWGSNENGRLGAGVQEAFSRAPVVVRLAKQGN